MKNRYKYVFLILGILLLLIGGITLFLSNRPIERFEELDIKSDLVQKLYKYIDHGNDNSSLSVYLMTRDSVDFKTMDDAFKFMIALRNINSNGMKIDTTKCEALISKNEVDLAMKKIFNNADYDFSKEYTGMVDGSMDCGSLATFKYDSLSNNYIGKLYALGGFSGYQSPFQTKLYEAYRDKKKKDILIKEKILYLKETCESETCDYAIYKDFAYQNQIGTEKNLKTSEQYDFFNQYLKEASAITYTFKLENNNYYFYGSKVDR